MIYGVPGQQEGGNPLGDPLQVRDGQQTHHTACVTCMTLLCIITLHGVRMCIFIFIFKYMTTRARTYTCIYLHVVILHSIVSIILNRVLYTSRTHIPDTLEHTS